MSDAEVAVASRQGGGLCVRDLTVTYRNGHTALRDTSFEIPDGSIWMEAATEAGETSDREMVLDSNGVFFRFGWCQSHKRLLTIETSHSRLVFYKKNYV